MACNSDCRAMMQRLALRIVDLEICLPPLEFQHSRMKSLIAFVANVSGVSADDIKSPVRSRKLVLLRYAIAWAAREHYDLSYPAIGRAMGDRDHTTIRNLHSRAKELQDQDPLFRTNLERIARFITAQKAKSARLHEGFHHAA